MHPLSEEPRRGSLAVRLRESSLNGAGLSHAPRSSARCCGAVCASTQVMIRLASESLAARMVTGRVEKPAAYALRWSDHAPVTVEFG